MNAIGKPSVMGRRAALCVLVALALAAGAFAGPPSAFGASSWWHVTTDARPGYLHGGVGTNAVHELTISATTGMFYVSSEEAAHPGHAFVPYNATHEEFQSILEGIYGAGNVEVPKGQGDAKGDDPYEIVFKGELAEQPVEPLFFYEFLLEGGEAPSEYMVKAKGKPDGEIVVSADNLGSSAVEGAKAPITITDKLPKGLRAVGAVPVRAQGGRFTIGHVACSVESVSEASCRYEDTEVAAYAQLEMVVEVVVEKDASSGELNEATVIGGETPTASGRHAITIDSGPTPFGMENYELTLEDEHGRPDTQAGSHPFQTTFTFDLNQLEGSVEGGSEHAGYAYSEPAALIKDLHAKLPPGLVGNPEPFPQCTLADFYASKCSQQTVLGVAQIEFEEPTFLGVTENAVAVYNLEPSVGEPARFGFLIARIPVFIDSGIRTGEDYGITGDTNNISQEGAFLTATVTLWGVPGSSVHDGYRGENCLYAAAGTGGPCPALGEHTPPPFFSLPTSCTGPLQSSVEVDSWLQPGLFSSIPAAPMQATDGCNRVPFSPSVKLTPDGTAASTPTGLNVDEHVPQASTLNGEGLAESDVKGLTVALPEGVALNPAAADGLESCSLEQIGLQNGQAPGCTNASKIATVKIKTPLLPNPLEGSAYLATQDQNPFGSLVAMYVFAEDPISGVVAKAAGELVENPVTGQLTAHFEEDPFFSKNPRYVSADDFLPQVPFEDVELHFFGGDRAPLVTPARCGAYTTQGSFVPWSGSASKEASSSFEITSGVNGSPCPTPLPFAPELTAGTTSIQAGGFSPFTMTMSRQDGGQGLEAIKLRMPPGLSGTLSTVKLCGEEQADAGTCPADTEIGETIVSVGVGGDPFSVKGGKVFITGPYRGAPFGLSIVNPAKAGPFDLGKVVVRAKVDVDPITSVLTITTDTEGPYKIPTILDGIPLEIRHVNVDIDRPDFTFNPTNCSPLAITGSLTSVEGATSALSVPFQATNCAVLAFKPKLTATTSGKTSRKNGASLTVKLTYPAGPYDANIAKVKVDLPKQLPSVLTTLQKACLAATFEANPASCPPGSIVGSARATTPVLPVALAGPAYFVSYGGAKFPELVIVLSGYGVTVQLHGETFIDKEGITSSTFKTIPDVPVGTFELTLPSGPNSALAANGDFCKSKLVMPTSFVGQNGALIKTTTPIAVTGCKPAINVIRHGVKGSTVTIAASVPSAGKLVASGPGLSRAAKRIGKAGTITLALELSKAQRLLLSKHPGRMLKIGVKLTFAPTHGQMLSGGVTVLIG
jgi:hypothetical protein